MFIQCDHGIVVEPRQQAYNNKMVVGGARRTFRLISAKCRRNLFRTLRCGETTLKRLIKAPLIAEGI